MCVCSYCFLCSASAAAVETEHNVSNFITEHYSFREKEKMCDRILNALGFMSTCKRHEKKTI